MKKIIYLSLLAISIVSCSNPMNREYNKETVKEDFKAITQEDAATEEEMQVITGWLMRSELSNESVEGKTYAEILDKANDFKREQEELAEKARKEEEAKIERLNKAVTVSLYEKVFVASDYNVGRYEDYLCFKYVIENKENKKIKALKFDFDIYNSLGEKLMEDYSISVTEKPVNPSSSVKGDACFNYNNYKSGMAAVKTATFDNLMFKIKVEKIVYEDGTVLE